MEKPSREDRAFLFLTYYFQYTKRTITHLPCRGILDLVWFEGYGRGLQRFGGGDTILGGPDTGSLFGDGEGDFEGAGLVGGGVEDSGAEGELAVREVDGERE